MVSARNPVYADSQRIFDKLFLDTNGNRNIRNYNPEIIPRVDPKKPLDVDILLYTLELLKFEHETQALSMIFWLEMSWVDERLRWDPKDYGGIEFITVSPTTVWVPDMTLYNSADGAFHYSDDLSNQVHVDIAYNGSLNWVPILPYTFSCPMQMRFFPFDYQTCKVKMGSWIHEADSLQFNLMKNETEKTYFTPSNTWRLEKEFAVDNNITYETGGTYQDVKFFFILSRNPTQYVINIVITCIALCFLCLFSFVIPCASGERLSLSLSIIIAIAVYQLVAMDVIPTGSDEITILSYFLTILIFLVLISVLITMINLTINEVSHANGPKRCIFLFFVEGRYSLGTILFVRQSSAYEKYEALMIKKSKSVRRKTIHVIRHQPRLSDLGVNHERYDTSSPKTSSTDLTKNNMLHKQPSINKTPSPSPSISQDDYSLSDADVRDINKEIDDFEDKIIKFQWLLVSIGIDRLSLVIADLDKKRF